MSKASFRVRPDQVMESEDLTGISTRSKLMHRYSMAQPAVESIVPSEKLCWGYYDEEARLLYLQDTDLKVYSLDSSEFKRIYTVREVERFAVNRIQPTRFIVQLKSKLQMEMHDVYQHVVDNSLLFGTDTSATNLRLWLFFNKCVIVSGGKTLYCLINPGEKGLSSRLVEAVLPFTISYVSMGETYLVVCFEDTGFIYVLCNKSLKVLLKYEISSTRVKTAVPLAFVPSLSLFMFVANTCFLCSVTLPLNFHQKKGSSKPALLKTPLLVPTFFAMAHVGDRTKMEVSLVRGGRVGVLNFMNEKTFSFVDATNRCVDSIYTLTSEDTILLLRCPPESNSRHYFIVGSHLCYMSTCMCISELFGLHKVSPAALEKKFIKALRKNDLEQCLDIASCRAEG